MMAKTRTVTVFDYFTDKTRYKVADFFYTGVLVEGLFNPEWLDPNVPVEAEKLYEFHGIWNDIPPCFCDPTHPEQYFTGQPEGAERLLSDISALCRCPGLGEKTYMLGIRADGGYENTREILDHTREDGFTGSYDHVYMIHFTNPHDSKHMDYVAYELRVDSAHAAERIRQQMDELYTSGLLLDGIIDPRGITRNHLFDCRAVWDKTCLSYRSKGRYKFYNMLSETLSNAYDDLICRETLDTLFHERKIGEKTMILGFMNPDDGAYEGYDCTREVLDAIEAGCPFADRYTRVLMFHVVQNGRKITCSCYDLEAGEGETAFRP